ncbi:HGGxSTG domain-containing protein [Bacillus thuringiensis]|uniref:HGGxSTG domain-containing protein n=1 Tax=Bacillus thuringiensis TaxID=1428 RepID=UPI00159C956A|nr:HGGxSTG domain-containing protein [Bacillus thuringiensis]
MTDAEKRLISKLKKNAHETVAEINGMTYDKSRKDKITAPVKNELKKTRIICGSIRADTGKICSEPPVEGAARCAMHGGLSTGPKTEEGKKAALANLNPMAALVHGLNSRFVMTVEEEALYSAMMNLGIEKFQLDEFNIIMLHRGLMALILNERKEIAKAGEIIDESNSYNDYDSKFLKYMQALGLDRKFNESTNNKNNDKGINMNLLFDM